MLFISTNHFLPEIWLKSHPKYPLTEIQGGGGGEVNSKLGRKARRYKE